MRLKTGTAAALLAAVSVFGCRSAPVPSEAARSEIQERELRGAGAPLFLGSGFGEYGEELRSARAALRREELKLGWFRDYGKVRTAFAAALEHGERLRAEVERIKAAKRAAVAELRAAVQERARRLDEATLSMGERGRARQRLARAQVLIGEAERLDARALPDDALDRLEEAAALLGEAEAGAMAHVGRYLDEALLAQWRRWAEDTVAQSRSRGSAAIVVSKLEKTLVLYRGGVERFRCAVGLGFGGLSNKIRSGDSATPEGRYRVVRKIPASSFYKALLLDYPTDEDRRRHAEAIRRGDIAPGTPIGGSIEIHGGGRDILTRGCISVDDPHMDVLYDAVPAGTPVTIVGSLASGADIVGRIKGTPR